MSLSSYVKGLKLAAPPAGKIAGKRAALRSAAKDGSEQGYVDAGSMVSFTNELTGPHRDDVLNSTLLAQLAADAQYDRLTNTDDWYKYYINVLGKVGWNIQQFQFEEYTTSGQTLKVNSVILEIAAEILTEQELAVVKRTIDSLSTSGNDPWWVIFDTKSCGPSRNGNFQVAPCKEDSSGQVIMSLCSFYFTASSTQQRWLWFEYQATNMHLFKGSQVSTLNESVYEQVRQDVIDKLGDNAKTFIGDLEI